ncbi:MAG: hypothetical protein ACXWKP_09130 [Bradyrhizobium sp.]|jgi:hypothetical protein
MRTLVLAPVILLASSAVYPASAIDAKTDVQTHLQQQQQQKGTNETSDKASIDRNSDNREVGRDLKMEPGDHQTVGKAGDTGKSSDDRKIDPDWKARPDRN